MTKRQVLVHASAHERVAEPLAALPHDLDVLLWSPDGVTRPDGSPVEAAAPEAAWISMDVFFSGDFGPMADAVVRFGSVRWTQGFLAGVDAPPFQKVIEAGIRFSNSDAPNAGVAEYTLSALLANSHGLAARIDAQRESRWAQRVWPEINGQRWLIIGFGSIGHEIAARARPFGVEIIGARRTAIDDPAADAMVTMSELESELGRADAVIIACPLTDETRGLVDADFLGAMKTGATFVNVARGAIVNDADLITALATGRPGTAILDVFDPEPLPEDHPFWTNPSIVVTSHVAGAGSGMGSRNDTLFVRQLDDFLSGRPLRLEIGV